jgi:hypothetical protein
MLEVIAFLAEIIKAKIAGSIIDKSIAIGSGAFLIVLQC